MPSAQKIKRHDSRKGVDGGDRLGHDGPLQDMVSHNLLNLAHMGRRPQRRGVSAPGYKRFTDPPPG